MRVTRTVDVDRLFGEVLTRAYARMGQEAANEAVDLAPVDRGHLKSSMMLQHGDVTYKGGGINIVAIWRPREKGKASTGPGPLEYGSYLNRPTGGTETVPAGKRTYPGPRSTGSGKLFGRHSGTWEWRSYTKRRAADPRYTGTPRKGNPTKGWFAPGVVDQLRRRDVPDKIARLAAKELEAGWNR